MNNILIPSAFIALLSTETVLAAPTYEATFTYYNMLMSDPIDGPYRSQELENGSGSMTFEKGSVRIDSVKLFNQSSTFNFASVPGSYGIADYTDSQWHGDDGSWDAYAGTQWRTPILMEVGNGANFLFFFTELNTYPQIGKEPNLSSGISNFYAMVVDAPGYSTIANLGFESYFMQGWVVETHPAHVPEPATFGLAALGLAAIGVVRRRKLTA